MKIDVLYSGSSGNACRVFNRNTSILIDCGVSRTKLFSKNHFPIDAIFVSHDHSDHINFVPVLARSSNSAVYIHKLAYEHKVKQGKKFFKDVTVECFDYHDTFEIGDFKVVTHPKSHDSPGSVYFTVEERTTNQKYCILTDTGFVTEEMIEVINTCNALLIEANHDLDLLDAYKGYPEYLKARIRSDMGHLSNHQTIEFFRTINIGKMQGIVLGHISERSNKVGTIMQAINDSDIQYNHFYFPPCIVSLE